MKEPATWRALSFAAPDAGIWAESLPSRAPALHGIAGLPAGDLVGAPLHHRLPQPLDFGLERAEVGLHPLE